MVQRAEWITSGVPLTKEEKRGFRSKPKWEFLIGGVLGIMCAGLLFNLIEGRPILEFRGYASVLGWVLGFVLTHLLYPQFGSRFQKTALAKKLGLERGYMFDLALKREGIYLGGGPAVGWFENGLFRIRSTTIGFDLDPHDIVTSPLNERQDWESPVYTLSREHEGLQVYVDKIASVDSSVTDRPVIDFSREFSEFMKEAPKSSVQSAPPIQQQPELYDFDVVTHSKRQNHELAVVTRPAMFVSFGALLVLPFLEYKNSSISFTLLAVFVFSVVLDAYKSAAVIKQRCAAWSALDGSS